MSKITDILGDIIHTACVAECSSDEAIQKQALGDIYDALASVLPVDHSRTGRAPTPGVATERRDSAGREGTPGTGEDGKVVVYKTPQHVLDFIAEIANVPFADMADPELLKKLAETHRLVPNKGEDGLTGMAKFLHIRDGLQMYRFRGPDFTELMGCTKPHCGNSRHLYKIRVSKVEPNGGQANLYVDGKLIFTLGSRFNSSVVEKMSIYALKRFEKVHIQRNKRKSNQRKRKAAEKRAAAREDAGREGTPGTGEEA